MIEKYSHQYGDGKSAEVYVKSELKGRHKEHCLCFQGCINFKPCKQDNCTRAQELFEYDCKYDMVTPVWECPEYKV